jgi:hypothetical protein
VGAIRHRERLTVVLTADADWQGVLRFDLPRHREYLKLPVNYPRLNEFPEWFTVEAGRSYRVRIGRAERRASGVGLQRGLPVVVRRQQTLVVRVQDSR